MKRNDAETVFSDIYTTLLEKQREIGDVVDGYLSNTPNNNQNTVIRPAVDIVDDSGVVVVCVDLPGIERDKIVLDITESSIELRADYTDEAGAEKKFLKKERYNEILERKISLPDGLDINSTGAKFEGGVLTVTIPKIVDAEDETTDLEEESNFKVNVD